MINIYRDPMTTEDIRAIRKTVVDGQKLEDSIAFKEAEYATSVAGDIAKTAFLSVFGINSK